MFLKRDRSKNSDFFLVWRNGGHLNSKIFIVITVLRLHNLRTQDLIPKKSLKWFPSISIGETYYCSIQGAYSQNNGHCIY